MNTHNTPTTKITQSWLNKRVLVRTVYSGVHAGVLLARCPASQECILVEDRIVYEWEGAFTTIEVAAHGITGGRVSQPSVEPNLVSGVIAILPMSDQAWDTLREYEHRP